MSAEKVALGRRLFYDTRLSGNGTQACASCHRPERAFADGKAHAVGSTGALHPRGSMSLANVAYNSSFTWVDAGRETLEEQALGPMLNQSPVELGLLGIEAETVERLASDPGYLYDFAAAFPGEPITLLNVRKALASFERTLISGDSLYDHLVWLDDREALSESAKRGMKLFFSEVLACSKCHAGFTFSGPTRFDGTAPDLPAFHDTGLGGSFRAPTLRNIAVTGPYMHDGRFETLKQVIDYYASGGAPSPTKSPLLRGFRLTSQDRQDLIQFLESLTDQAFLSDPRTASPDPPRLSTDPLPAEVSTAGEAPTVAEYH